MLMKKRVLTTIILLGIGAVACIGLSVFLALNMSEIKATIDEGIQRTNERFELQRGISKLSQGLGATRTRIAAFSDIGMIEGRELAFIQALERAAEAEGVDQDLNLGNAGEELSEWEAEVPITINASGPYIRVLRFIRAIEKMRYHVLVTSIDMRKAQGAVISSTPDDVTVTISGTMFKIGKTAPTFVGLNGIAKPGTPAPVETPTPAPQTDTPAAAGGATVPADSSGTPPATTDGSTQAAPITPTGAPPTTIETPAGSTTSDTGTAPPPTTPAPATY